MPYIFEIYLVGQSLTSDQWTTLFKAFTQYGGVLSQFKVVVRFDDNVVRFYVVSSKDLGPLSNNLDGVILRPVDEELIKQPTAANRLRFINFVEGGNLLDLKEKFEVKKAVRLEMAVLKMRALNSQKSWGRLDLYFQNAAKEWSVGSKILSFFPSHLLSVDFQSNTKYMQQKQPKYLDIQKALHIMQSDATNALFEVNTFPFLPHNYYLSLQSYEFDKHSFIIGASGSGKSKLISLFVDRLYNTGLKLNYRVIVIDPHASIADDFAHIIDSKVVSFGKQDSTDLFPGANGYPF
jgi:hypothetical protein